MRCADKRQYQSEAEALAFAKQFRKKHQKKQRTYLCPCGWWHLASIKPQPKPPVASEAAAPRVPSTGELRRKLKRLEHKMDRQRAHRAYLQGKQVAADIAVLKAEEDLRQAQAEALRILGY